MPRKRLEETEREEPQAAPDGRLHAYADFEFDGQAYKAGDVFEPPAGLLDDPAFTELRNLQEYKGAAFSWREKRVLLPVR